MHTEYLPPVSLLGHPISCDRSCIDGDRITHTIGGEWKFGFRTVAPGPASPSGGEEAEKPLLSLLAALEERCQELRFELVHHYRCNGQLVDALAAAKDCLDHARSTKGRYEAYFHLGLLMEQQQDWRSGVAWYEAAKESGTNRDFMMYYIYNNLGYCLNQLGRFEGSQPLFRMAAQIDPLRANAY
jgi:tetratricopeptide (TPR) repeat protein